MAQQRVVADLGYGDPLTLVMHAVSAPAARAEESVCTTSVACPDCEMPSINVPVRFDMRVVESVDGGSRQRDRHAHDDLEQVLRVGRRMSEVPRAAITTWRISRSRSS